MRRKPSDLIRKFVADERNDGTYTLVLRGDALEELWRSCESLERDAARLDWIWVDPYVRLQEVRRMLPVSGYPTDKANDGLRVAIDQAAEYITRKERS